ncbi:DUF3048 domain-containing protein [Agromyces sp. NPDC058064]|uniref:DUF3048 domain-containing protein n=1 Tax=Agromyces sp. NPDC058064 TaxID=3346322 RepID=UPI0036DB1798
MVTGGRGALRRRGTPLVVVAVAALLLVGCQQGPPEPVPTPEPTAEPRPVGSSQPIAVAFSPLRGTPTDPAAPRHPSLAAKIDNHDDARPQIALNRTDLVYEELVEGGLTRYLAVWHSDLPPTIGPVRSIRPMDPDIASPLGGVIAYSGGQDQFVAMMMATPLVNVVFDLDETGLYSRADERPGPHDVILDAAETMARNSALAPPPVQFDYGTADPLAAPELAAAPTSRIALVFSEARAPTWDWDAGSSSWLRSQEGVADVEEGGARVRATNVVTLEVGIDWRYGEVPKTVLIGSGEAWVSVAGRTAHGTWTKDAAGSPITLAADDGSPLRLAPGNTWIELVPAGGTASFTP